jgi:hypothetical protein
MEYLFCKPNRAVEYVPCKSIGMSVCAFMHTFHSTSIHLRNCIHVCMWRYIYPHIHVSMHVFALCFRCCDYYYSTCYICVSCHFQAVYLKRRGVFRDSPTVRYKPLDATSSLNPLDSTEDKSDLLVVNSEDPEDSDDRDDSSDLAEGISSFQNILRDMIPGVKVKVLKVTAPGKVDRDLISKVIEQIIEEEDEEKDNEIENVEAEDEVNEISDLERDDIEMDADPGVIESEERNEIAVKVVVGGLAQKLSNSVPTKDLLRVPANLEKKGRLSFSFSIEKNINEQDSGGKEQASVDKSKLRGQRSIDHVMFDLAKFIGREKIPLKVGLKFLLGILCTHFPNMRQTYNLFMS